MKLNNLTLCKEIIKTKIDDLYLIASGSLNYKIDNLNK